MSVLNFLNRAMHVALSPRTNPLTFVFGNEGGDIDSVVSAIYTALLLSPSWEEPSAIPVVNFPREDLRLRGDVWTMLRDYGITENNLLFEEHLHKLNTVSTSTSSADNASNNNNSIIRDCDKIVLTDHNVLRGTQKHWAGQVVGIVDHHADEKLYDTTINKHFSDMTNENTSASPPSFVTAFGTPLKKIELIGSATSLVTSLWQKADTLITSTPPRAIPDPILLMCPIVQDTGNFKSKKNTPTDEAARDYIINGHIFAKEATATTTLLPNSNHGHKRTAAILAIEKGFYEDKSPATDRLAKHLAALKEDIRGLTVPETLRRDYKRFELSGNFVVGISAVLLTKKQCRKLYAVKRNANDDNDAAALPAGAESDDETVEAADENEDVDLIADPTGNSSNGGFPTDCVDWLPSIAARMEANHLNVYMNMFNKKGRELEVIYRAEDAEQFEAVWNAFVAATEKTVALTPKKRFADGKAFEYTSSTTVPAGCSASAITVKGSALKQIVYRQHQTSVSRKNFTPFLVDHFKAFFSSNNQKKPSNDDDKEKEEEQQQRSDL